MQIGSKYATAVSSDYKESCKSKVVTSSVEVVDTGLALGAHGVGGPAEQRAEIEFGAGRVAQDGDGAIGRRSIAGHDIHRFASAVECPAEGGDGRFGLNTAFHFAGQSFGSAVRVPLFRTAHRLICQGEMCQKTQPVRLKMIKMTSHFGQWLNQFNEEMSRMAAFRRSSRKFRTLGDCR